MSPRQRAAFPRGWPLQKAQGSVVDAELFLEVTEEGRRVGAISDEMSQIHAYSLLAASRDW